MVMLSTVILITMDMFYVADVSLDSMVMDNVEAIKRLSTEVKQEKISSGVTSPRESSTVTSPTLSGGTPLAETVSSPGVPTPVGVISPTPGVVTHREVTSPKGAVISPVGRAHDGISMASSTARGMSHSGVTSPMGLGVTSPVNSNSPPGVTSPARMTSPYGVTSPTHGQYNRRVTSPSSKAQPKVSSPGMFGTVFGSGVTSPVRTTSPQAVTSPTSIKSPTSPSMFATTFSPGVASPPRMTSPPAPKIHPQPAAVRPSAPRVTSPGGLAAQTRMASPFGTVFGSGHSSPHGVTSPVQRGSSGLTSPSTTGVTPLIHPATGPQLQVGIGTDKL